MIYNCVASIVDLSIYRKMIKLKQTYLQLNLLVIIFKVLFDWSTQECLALISADF